ncbi:SRSF protein kinase 3-like isoform X2 [Amphiura filiformis]|uniref:SRSF protein kinase 3-like isoform X2 n=1 Tax=Amphiura filiformis TaxID=82378 RepID=UPI003B218AC5
MPLLEIKPMDILGKRIQKFILKKTCAVQGFTMPGSKSHHHPHKGSHHKHDSRDSSVEEKEEREDEEHEEELLGSDDDEQEDPKDYCKGGYHHVKIGDLFNGRYHVVRKLGWGHFSTVWLAWDLTGRQYVALKVVKSAHHYTETALDEIKLLRAVRSTDADDPNRERVVQLLDDFKVSGANGTHVCMVFEVLGNNLLKPIIQSRYMGLPIQQVKSIIRQTLEGLDYLHTKCKIIHTDIKPENILLSVDEEYVRKLAQEAKGWVKGQGRPPISSVSTAPVERKPSEKMSKNKKRKLKKKQKKQLELLEQQDKQLQELDQQKQKQRESMENLHLKMDTELQSPTSDGGDYDRTPCSTPLSEVYTPLSETCTSISEACTPLSEAASPLSETHEPLIAATQTGAVDNVEDNTVVESPPKPKRDSDQDENNDSGNEADSPQSPAASEDVPTTNGTDATKTNSTCTNISNITQNQNNNTEDSSESSASPSKKDSDNDKCNPQRLKEDSEAMEKDKGEETVGTTKSDGPWEDDNLLCNGFVDASDGSEERSDRLEEVKKSEEKSSENGSKESSTCSQEDSSVQSKDTTPSSENGKTPDDEDSNKLQPNSEEELERMKRIGLEDLDNDSDKVNGFSPTTENTAEDKRVNRPTNIGNAYEMSLLKGAEDKPGSQFIGVMDAEETPEKENENENENENHVSIINESQTNESQMSPPALLDNQELKVKIADLGNACWTHHHFTEDIQTRQYRALEVLVGAGYDVPADIWSTACMAFELACGDYLFEPHSGPNYNRDEDHIAHIIELMGSIPKHVALSGKYSREFFNRRGELRHITKLKPWGMYNVLTEKSEWPHEGLEQFASFLLPMLEFDPAKRATAAKCLKHPWLYS